MPCTSNWIKWDTEIGKVELLNIELLFYIYIIYIICYIYYLYYIYNIELQVESLNVEVDSTF